MISELKVPLGCLFIVIYIFFCYKKNKRMTTETSRIFYAILVLTEINLITDFITTLFANIDGGRKEFLFIWGYSIFLESIIVLTFLLDRFFLVNIELAEQKSHKAERYIAEIIFVVASIAMLVSPVKFAQGFESYAYGPKLSVIYIVAVITACAAGIRYYKYKSILEEHGAYTMRNTTIIMSAMIVFQGVIPEISITEFGYTLAVLGIYLSMENPEKFVHPETGIFNERALRVALSEHDVSNVSTPIFVYAFRTEEENDELIVKIMKESADYMSRFRRMCGYHLADGVIVFIKNSGWEKKKAIKNVTLPKLSKDYKAVMEFSTSFNYPTDCRNFDEVMERLEEFKLQNADAELFVDKMTGIYNRNRYEKDVATFLEEKTKLCYFVADINNLKITNDKFGHLAGDGLIKDMARVLQDVFSKEGHVYRTGGDEFAIVYMGDETPEDMIEAVKNACKETNKHRSLPVRYAIGYALYDKSVNTWKEVVEKADSEMYKDKAANPERIKYEE